MSEYAVIAADGSVLNVVSWDGESKFAPPEGATLQEMTPDLQASWLAQTAPPPLPVTPAQEYITAICSGVQVASASAPALNGTYAIGDDAVTVISGIYSGIRGGDGLPGNGASFGYADLAGAPHGFTAEQFVAFAKAVRDYRYALSVALQTALAGGGWTAPPQQVKIP